MVTWKFAEAAAAAVALVKRAGWSRVYNFDFSGAPELAAGTITGATATFDAGVTAGAPSIAGGVVSVRLSGGEAGNDYGGEVEVTTGGGDTLSIACVLRVR